MINNFPSLLLCRVLFVICLVFSAFSQAQEQSVTLKTVVESEQVAENLKDKIKGGLEPNQVGRTPLSTVLAIIDAGSKQQWDEAGKYIDMRYLDPKLAEEGAGELVRKLAVVWKQQRILDLSTVSDSPEGMQQDNLPPYRDLLGKLVSTNGVVPLYLQRIPDGKGGKVWKVSNATVSQIPVLWDEFGYHEQIENLARYLPDFTVLNMENWQFVAFVLIIVSAWLVTNILSVLSPLLFSRIDKLGPILVNFFGKSMRMFLFFILIDYGTTFLGLSMSAKVWITSGTLVYLGGIYLVIGLIELVVSLYLLRVSKNSAAIIRPLVMTLKIIVTLLMILSWFESAGYNIGTILTGLGIGSLAIALAAQKTLENVFGAFTIYVAKPIQPGDFCKFGDITGTVEEIGLRSTRIRKLNRSVVHVPNSVFSSKELENFSEIDRRHYRREFRFRLDSSSDQLRQLLIQIRDLLLRHERVLPTAARARFEEIERDAFVVVVNCYIETKSIVDFKAVAEDLNLYILDIIRDLGIQWAIPQQQILIGKAPVTDESLVQEAHNQMRKLREENELPFPDFSEEDIDKYANTLGYPTQGAITAKRVNNDAAQVEINDVDDCAEDVDNAEASKN